MTEKDRDNEVEKRTAEFVRMLSGEGRADAIDRSRDMLAELIPEVRPMFSTPQNNPNHVFNVWAHTVESIRHADTPKMATAMFFHDIGKPATRTTVNGIDHFFGHAAESARIAGPYVERLGFSAKDTHDIMRIIECHDEASNYMAHPDDKKIRYAHKLVTRYGTRLFLLLCEAARCDFLAQNPALAPVKLAALGSLRTEGLSYASAMGIQADEFSVDDLAVRTGDFMDMGYAPGRELRWMMDHLAEDVIGQKVPNRRDVLLDRGSVLLSGIRFHPGHVPSGI